MTLSLTAEAFPLTLSRNPQGGVNYIAQVLKRNRTLKVLNLSENRIDHLGLAALAEALVGYKRLLSWRRRPSLISRLFCQKYNSTLETLDLSQNLCCGPALDGVRTTM